MTPEQIQAVILAHVSMLPDAPGCWLWDGNSDNVREIRRRAAAGERHSLIARSLGICQANVSMIVSRRTWRHVA